MVTTADTLSQLQSDAGSDFNQQGVWVVIVAGGSGHRFGSLKQFEVLGEQRIIDVSLDTAQANADGVVLVLPEDGFDDYYAAFLEEAPHQKELIVVPGGASRGESVARGLDAVPLNVGIILIHDAARPLASKSVYERVIGAVTGGAVAVVPAVPVTDSIRHSEHGAVEREGLWSVQTPQGFHAVALRRAHDTTEDYDGVTDDAMLVESSGHSVTLVAGDPSNIKVTHRNDLAIAELLLTIGPETEPA